MSLDADTVRRVASLARIRMEPAELARMEAELNGILGWAVSLRLRDDAVTDGGRPEAVLANAPDRESAYFGVPKVVE